MKVVFDGEEILAGLSDWVSIESPTYDAARVNQAMDKAEAAMKDIGAATSRIPGKDGLGDIMLARISGEHNGPGILILGHLDTVHEVGALAGPLNLRREGDKVFGPGIYDMKGGDFIAYWALRHLAKTGGRPKLPVTFMFIPDEEIGSPTSRAPIEAEARQHKYVLVPEPAGEGGKLTTGRYGIARYKIRTRGQPAHAGANHQDGRSAIREMARQIVAIEEMTDYARKITLNVGKIQGGTHVNVVPIDCHGEILALVPDQAAETEVMERLAALKPVDPDVELEIERGLFRPPFGMSAEIETLYNFAKDIAVEIGFEPGHRAAGGGSDGNFTGAMGIPTLDGLGVVGGGAHTFEEHVLVSSLAPRATMWLRMLERLV